MNHKTIVVTDEHLIPVVEALTNLADKLKVIVQNGTVNLNLAVQIGRKLGPSQQHQYLELCQDTNVPDKYSGKVVHAIALQLPEWAILEILRIYTLADRTRAAIITFNDLMDEYEELRY